MRLTHIFLIVIFLSSCSRKKEIHLIPQGYQGPLFIFFEIDNGQDFNEEDGGTVYQYSAEGIYISKFSREDGWIAEGDRLFYYVDTITGERTIIEEIWDIKEIDTMKSNVFVCSGIVGVASSDKNNKQINFESFILSNRTQLDSFYERRNDIFPPDLIE